VGDRTVSLARAEAWVGRYTDGETSRSRTRPYAFPAYDTYDTGSHPDVLSDADLLAPVLLNVGIPIRAYYDLQGLRGDLEAALRRIPSTLRLEDAPPDRISDLVEPLYAVLDDRARKPRDVRVTKLSKLLHRKRPEFVVLHDRWVWTCYQQRLGQDATRTRARYMADLSCLVAEDLRAAPAAWDHLVGAVATHGPLSRVRVLDIVAWHLGQEDPAPPAPVDD